MQQHTEQAILKAIEREARYVGSMVDVYEILAVSDKSQFTPAQRINMRQEVLVMQNPNGAPFLSNCKNCDVFYVTLCKVCWACDAKQ